MKKEIRENWEIELRKIIKRNDIEMTKQFKFEDERCDGALEDIHLAFNGLWKLYSDKIQGISEKEVWAMKDIFYLDFDNHYGEKVNWIGDTIVAYREAMEEQKDLILKKSEHIIERICGF